MWTAVSTRLQAGGGTVCLKTSTICTSSSATAAPPRTAGAARRTSAGTLALEISNVDKPRGKIKLYTDRIDQLYIRACHGYSPFPLPHCNRKSASCTHTRHTHARTHARTHTHTHTHAHTHTHTHVRTHTRTLVRTHAHAHMYARTLTHTHTHARTHTHTHIHSHTSDPFSTDNWFFFIQRYFAQC